MNATKEPNLTLFHCINSFKESAGIFDGCHATTVKMACSSMTKDIQLLKAFEAGADVVLVLVCPQKACRYAEGSIRAEKRVEYVKGILDEIGMDGRRLKIFNTTAAQGDAIRDIIVETISEIEKIGPNPALTQMN